LDAVRPIEIGKFLSIDFYRAISVEMGPAMKKWNRGPARPRMGHVHVLQSVIELLKQPAAKRPALRAVERLEDRYCLTVAAALDNGMLAVTGDADGAVAITATDATTYKVSDNNADVATVSNVTGGIKVAIDATAGKDDTVTIDLGEQSVDRVMANLGDGDNNLTLQNGTVNGNLQFTGGTGNDSLTLVAGATVAKSLTARMGAGDNALDVEGTVSRDVVMIAGAGDDTLTIGADATISRNVIALLGGGDNTVSIAGDVARGATILAGRGNDTVDVTSDATIGRSVVAALGSGDNKLSVEGTIEGSLVVSGRDGNDDVTIDSDAAITGNLVAILGDGSNSVNVQGSVGNNLVVTSANSADTVTVADGAVGGQTIEHLGDTFHHHGFGFGFGGGNDHAGLSSDGTSGEHGTCDGSGAGSGNGSASDSGSSPTSGSTTTASNSLPSVAASIVSGSTAAISPFSRFIASRFFGFRRFGR
jgi:hypothetical protein